MVTAVNRWRGWSTAILLAFAFAPTGANAIIPGDEAPDQSLWQPDYWRSALYLRTTNGECGAHTVGNRAILTSGFCVSGDRMQAQIRDELISFVCERHPEIQANTSLDYALCVTDRPIPEVAIEKINIDPALLKPNQPVLVGGFGCRLPGGVDRVGGVWTVAPAKLEIGPSSGYRRVVGAVLCFGDAGSGTFIMQGPDPMQRVLVGVNSRTDLKSNSWMAATSSAEFIKWATAWAAKNEVAVCGLSDVSSACQPEPPSGLPSPMPPNFAPTANILVGLANEAAAPPQSVEIARQKVMAQKGERLGQLVRRVCRDETASYLRQVEAMTGQKIDASLAEGQEVEIPACSLRPAQRAYIERKVKANDSVWQYFLDAIKVSRWQFFEAPANTSEIDKRMYFRNAFERLNPGVNVNQLVTGATVLIPIGPDGAEKGKSLPATGQGVAHAIFPLLQSSEGCRAVAPAQNHPFDAFALLDVLARNRQLRDSKKYPKTQRVHVVVADSGLYGAGSGIFPFNDVLVRPSAAESWNQYAANVKPVHDGPQPMHGSQVASLVLGGPLFARILLRSELPQIGLVIARIYEMRQTPGSAPMLVPKDQFFEEVFRNMASDSVHVVNLSLKTTTEILALHKEMQNVEQRVLFVVAAGNNDGDGGKVGVRLRKPNLVYPAAYGGGNNEGRWNLLTVAGLDNDGLLAPYSNWGAEYVEIAAPGCDVPALEFNPSSYSWSSAPLAGTSIAAPMVSFAAALMRSEMGQQAVRGMQVKRRLLASSDLDPRILKEVHDGRKLNVLKALSLYSDVVEAEGKLHFGDVSFIQNGTTLRREKDELVLNCDGAATKVQVADILKLVPNFKNVIGKDVIKVYRLDKPTSMFESMECLSFDDIKIAIRPADDQEPILFELNQMADFVKREYP